MASHEDARAAARRIVEEVLAGHGGREHATPGRTADAVHDLVDAAADELVVPDRPDVPAPDGGPAPAAVPQDEPVSEARARARALVAEVLAARTAPAATDGPPPPPPEVTSPPDAGPPPGDGPSTSDVADRTVSTARLRARELVAAALAEAEAREAELAAAEEERRAAEEVRRREAEHRRREAEEQARLEAEEREREEARAAEEARAEAERRAEEERIEAERHAEAERRRAEAAELERSRREEADRALWADVDRDRATATVQMDRRDDGPVDETVPLSVAELAAATTASSPEPEPPATVDEPAATQAVPRAEPLATVDDPAATQTMPRVEPTRPPARRGVPLSEPTATLEPPPRPRAPRPVAEEEVVSEHGVLEATVGLDEAAESPRTGRWLLVSIVGAVVLAVVFPLAIQALVRLVSLS